MADRKPFDVAIIGFGFSGVVVLSHLVQRSTRPLSIAIFDDSNDAGFGPAYATKRPEHLLNVRAGRMSAYAEKPDDFYGWCISEQGANAARALGYDVAITPETFVPRAMYGVYLEEIISTTEQIAAAKNITITHINEAVTTIENDCNIATKSGSYNAGNIVVASGFAFEDRLGTAAIREPWHFDFSSLANSVDTVALIGTGLTAVDTIMSLVGARFKGNIIAISRSSKFPFAHEKTVSHNHPVLPPLPEAITLAALQKYLKRAVRESGKQSHSWQSVMDAIRPQTVALWQKLSSAQQAQFLKRYFTLWNIHRHRMAPEIDGALKAALASGQVKLLQGRCIKVDKDGVEIEQQGELQRIECKFAFDCTGPSYTRLPPFATPLIEAGKIKMHASGVGLSADENGNISTNGNAKIYALGSLLLGERLETTAVPEIRGQAENVAAAILKSL